MPGEFGPYVVQWDTVLILSVVIFMFLLCYAASFMYCFFFNFQLLPAILSLFVKIFVHNRLLFYKFSAGDCLMCIVY